MMVTFLRWTGLAAAALTAGAAAIGALYDLLAREFCYSAADGPMLATFALFVVGASVFAGIVAVAVRGLRASTPSG